MSTSPFSLFITESIWGESITEEKEKQNTVPCYPLLHWKKTVANWESRKKLTS